MITGHMASWSSIIGQTLAVYSELGRQLSVQNSRLKSINKVGSVTYAQASRTSNWVSRTSANS